MTKTLIVGAGITGLAAAIVLSRQGADVDLVERQPRVRPVGSGITMIGAGIRALDRLGVYQECAASGWAATGIEFYAVDGTLAGQQPLPSPLGPGKAGMLGMTRPALHAILLDHAAKEGAEIRTATSPARVEQRPDGASVTFGSGEHRDYDLVIGADGLRSTVRDLLFGPVPLGRHDLGAMRALLPRPAEVTCQRNFRNHADVTVGVVPIAPDRMYLYGTFAAGADFHLTAEESVRFVREKTKPFGGLIAAMRDEIRDPEQIHVNVLETVLVPEPWYRGRVILIGDAAHAPTPQLAAGAALGLEDAIALGEELAAAPTIDGALRAFGERRFERCRYVTEATSRISRLQAHPTATSRAETEQILLDSFTRLAGPF